MALNDSGFTTMSGYVQRMKEEADRREEEEKRRKEEESRRQSLESWRRDVPVGPPTRQQSAPQVGPVEKPKPNISLPEQQRPTFDVSREQTDTSTPSLSSSQVTGNTVRSQVNPSAFNPQSMTMDALAKWNPPARPSFNVPQQPPKNTAVSMPLGPSLLPQVGQQLAGMGQNLVQGLSSGEWKMPDYETAIKTLQEQAPDMLKAIFPQGKPPATGVPTATDMALTHVQDSIAQRAKERKNVSVSGEIAANLVGNIIPGMGFAKDWAKPIGEAASHVFAGGMNLLDILNAGAEIAQAIPIAKGGATEGELYATLRDVGDKYNANMRPSVVKAATVAIDALVGSNPLYAPFTEQLVKNSEYLAVLDPAVWQSISNTAEYWDASTKRLTDAVTPTQAQLAGNTKEQIEWAKNYATYMTQFGAGVREAVFDDLLDAPVNATKKMNDAKTLAQMADSTPDESLRNQIYAEAGRLGAESVKLRETTPLDLYNKHQNMWYGAPNQMLFDPINSWDTAIDVFQLGMAARRGVQGSKVVDLGSEAVAAGSNKTLLETGKDFFMEWMKTSRSKANTDAATNASVLFNILSGVSTKGDIATVLRKVVDGSIMDGVPLAAFNGPEMVLQAAGDIVDFGKAGIKDWRFQKSKKALESIAGWVDNFPSLKGEADELANKILVQADILGALTRAGAQKHGVSAMGEIPWGAARFRVSPTTVNKAVVEYLDEAKNVIGQSAEMTLRAATQSQAQMQAAVGAGVEFKTNWLRSVVDLRRNIMSTYSINISPGQLINNAGGGLFNHMINNGFDMEYFRPLEQELEYLANKTGGMIMSSRVAEGAADVAPSSARFGVQGTTPQGQYNNWFGKLMNATTFGLAEKGRNLRQGDATIWGGRVKVGEEAMAASVYQATFRRFFEQEWAARLTPVVESLLNGKIQDPKVVKWITDHLVQTGISGNRVDLAKAFQDIANGRISLSLRSISPVLGDVIPPQAALEIDTLLRNLGVENLDQATAKITEVFAAQRKLLDMDASKFTDQFGRSTFTTLNDSKDVADIQQMYQNVARMTGQNLDIATDKAKEVGALQKKLGQYLLDIMQMSDGQSHNTEYLLDVWNRVQDMKDTVRREVGIASEKLRQYAKDAKVAQGETLESVGAPGPNRAPDAGPVAGAAYTVDESGNVLPNPARPPGEPYGDKGVGPYTSGRPTGDGNTPSTYSQWRGVPFSQETRGFPRDDFSSVNRPSRIASSRENISSWWEQNMGAVDLGQQLRLAFNLSDEETQTVTSLLDARMEAWSKMTGKDPSEYMAKVFQGATSEDIVLGGSQSGKVVQAWASANATDRIIRASEALRTAESRGYPVRTQLQVAIHELGHVFRFDMEDVAKTNPSVRKLMDEAKAWVHSDGVASADNGQGNGWTMRGEEYFAEGFEKYLQEGVAPTPGLKALFETFKNWLIQLVTGTSVDPIHLTDEMRNVYATMLGRKNLEPVEEILAPVSRWTKDFDTDRLNVTPGVTMPNNNFTRGGPSQGATRPPWTTQGGSAQLGDMMGTVNAAEAAPTGSRFTSAGPGTAYDQAPFTTKVGNGPIGQQAQAADPEATNLLNFNIKEEWAKFHAYADEQWKKFGDDAIAQMERARQDIQSGAAKAWVNQRGMAGIGEDANEILSNTSVDLEMLTEVLKQKVGFKDPRYEGVITTLRKGVDHFQQQMFVALSRYPTQESFDEYMDAIRDVAKERGKLLGKIGGLKKKINNTDNPLDEATLKSTFAQLEQVSKEGWNKWWNFAMERYKVGAYRVVEANLSPDAMKGLTFTPYADGKVWTLRGPDLLSPKVWIAVNEKNEQAKFPMGKGGVPKEVVQKFMDFRKATELEIMDQLGNIAYQSAKSKGLDTADSFLTQWNTPGTTELLNTIRRNVAEKMANFNAKPYTPADLPGWYRTKLDQGEMALKQVLGQVAQANSAGHGSMGLDTISEFNRNVLPLFDDVVSGAHRYGEEMLSLGMVNFTNEYHPDILLGLFAPYHYWWSRMAKNSLEQMIFNPKVSQLLARQMGYIEAENRDQNQPNRNLTSIPNMEVEAGDATYRAGALGLLRMIPWFPNMVMNGWANPDIANRAYEYASEAAKEQTFPGTAKGLGANAMLAHEFANQLGLSTYPEWDSIFDYAAGNPVDLRGKLGDMSSLARTLGWGAVSLAQWARDNNVPLVPPIAEGFAAATVPNYAPSIYSREAALAASRGDMNDNQAKMVQDVFAQQYSGVGPMPEQGLVNPQAAQQAQAIQQKTAVEYFVRGLLSWVSGMPIAAEYDNEIALNEAQKTKAASGFTPSRNPAGSQEARFSYTDPASQNFVPGLAPWEQRYSVMNEAAPQEVDPNVKRPGLSAAQNDYYTKADAIKEKYLAEQQAEYEKHPEWNTLDGLEAKGAYDKDWNDRKEAEEKALSDQYPSVIAAQGKEKTPWSLYGARPSETERAAQVRLRNQAYDELESTRPKTYTKEQKASLSNSEKVANSKAWDAWNAALDARIAELMNDPKAASAVVFDRALPRAGERPTGSMSDTLRGSGEQPMTPTTKNVVPQGGAVQPDPNNPYAAAMTAAEVENGLPPGLLQEVARGESNFDPNAESPVGAMGVMQIMPGTWDEWAKKVGVTDPWNAEDNIAVSAAYLAWLRDTLPSDKQDIRSVMIAYNWGIGNATNPNKTPPPETIAYANKIANAVESPTTYSASAAPSGQTFTNPNWGKQVGKWTVVGDPITDTGITWVFPFAEGDSQDVYQYYGETDVDGLGAYYASKNQGFGHEGIDFMRPEGTDVLSIADGKVIYVGDGAGNGRPAYGNMVVIEHANGMISRYGHLKDWDVNVGDEVTAGTVIGGVGHTPTTANIGNHLHLSVESPNESTGPYRTIDPFRLIGQGGSSSTPATQNVAKPNSPVGVAGADPDAIAWSQTPQQVADAGRNASKSEARVTADASIEAAFQGQIDRAMTTYPKYGKLFEDYKAVNEEDREAWRLANPMIRALNFVAYNPDEWTKLEKDYGKGVIEKWALIPPYAGEDSDVRSNYYHQYPDVFLVNAWIKGRPEQYDESGFVPDKEFAYNLGADFDEAKSLFGNGIWDTVRQYYQTPKYVKDAENTEWKAFKKEHPEFDAWSAWWYEKLGATAKPAFQFSQYGSGSRNYGGPGGFDGYGPKSPDEYIKGVEAMRGGAPKWGQGSGSDGDWRKYLPLGESLLKGWRR